MTLLARLKSEVLDTLAASWAPLFERHGLDIVRPLAGLAQELERPLPIDRTIPGFEDLALGAYRAIEPGLPGHSLLYHALASANVYPAGAQALFPTLEQLDLVENYIYSRVRARIDMFADPVVAVFAYQYRERDRTTHRAHADLAFSRTGVARIGTEAARYAPDRRGFEPRSGGDRGFRVLPARYAAFIAERRPQPPNKSVMRAVAGDSGLTFLFPVHKLFPGDECLFRRGDNDEPVPIPIPGFSFVERHVSEKLARIHRSEDNLGYIPPMTTPAFDLTEPPFVRDSRNDRDLVRLRQIGASVLVEPVAAPLVRTATQRVDGRDEVARFIVPKPAIVHDRRNRYWSTFEIPARGDSRAAPEYVNIRTEVRHEKGGGVVLADLNQAPPAEFDQKISAGGYEAAHFIDNSCDGALTIEPLRALGALPIHPAYSLVTAIDYFPAVDQMEIEEWLEKREGRSIGVADIEGQFPQGGPQPMSDGRFEWKRAKGELVLTRQLPNCALPHPVRDGDHAFSLADPANYTATAIVGAAPTSGCIGIPSSSRRAPSWLPDAAADVFAPGWDVSQHQIDNQNMYAAYGLGSPFPEDAKLCAALNSFWPAVAPDSARTYGWRPPIPFSKRGDQLKTSIPLTDAELGYHEDHPRVVSGEVRSQPGWDGDYGPFVVTVDMQRHVDAANPMRADQTRAALQGHVGFSGLDAVGTSDFIRRMEALRWCRKHLVVGGFNIGAAWLITFETVDEWGAWQSVVLPKASAELTGPGMIFVFAATTPGTEVGMPPLRRRFPVQHTLEVQMSGIARFSDLTAVLDDVVAPTVFYRLDGTPFLRHGVALVAAPQVVAPLAVAPPNAPSLEAANVERVEFPRSRVDTRLPQ